MNTITKTALAGLSIIAMATVFSPAWATNNTVPFDRTITSMRTYIGYAVVEYDPPFENSLSCSGSSANRAAVVEITDDPTSKMAYAALLTALVANSTIGLGIKDAPDCHPWGTSTPNIYRVDMK